MKTLEGLRPMSPAQLIQRLHSERMLKLALFADALDAWTYAEESETFTEVNHGPDADEDCDNG